MKKQCILFAAILSMAIPGFSSTIELINFSLRTNSNNVEINWGCILSDEKYQFIIEKSENAVCFIPVDTMYYETGKESYVCMDETPFMGISYYKVKCVGKNGEEVTSLISYVEFSSLEQDVPFKISGLFPMPFVDQFSLEIYSDKDVTLNIKSHNLDGRLMFEMSFPCTKGSNIIKMSDLVDLKNDTYYLTISDEYLYTKTTRLLKCSNL